MANFRSGFERSFAADLKLRKIDYDYECIKISYVLECEYNPDFYLKSHGFYIETKGLLSAADRRKHLAVRLQHPEIDVRFIFMQADKRMPGTKSTHAEWAKRNGFQYAEGKVPPEWLK